MMKIQILNTYDIGGGAEKVALDLYHSYRNAGHDVRMSVRIKRTLSPNVAEMDPYLNTPLGSICRLLEKNLRKVPFFRGQYRLVDMLRRTALPSRWQDSIKGKEDFNYPSSYCLFDNPAWIPDVIHAHNLHGDYFDLRALEQIDFRVPIVWTLHDTWSFTGHCGHFIDCQRWNTGCGECPDLHRPPGIRRDSTAENFQVKKKLYKKCRLSIATPSEWLISYVRKSILGMHDARIIPNGVDLSIYRPANRHDARRILGLPENVFICLYASLYGSGTNPYKDYSTVSTAIQHLTTSSYKDKIYFVCIGGSKSANQSTSRHTGYISDERQVALYFQAADVLLHAANAENFPLVVLESMACGTPVIATGVGGISEQVTDAQTGFLVSRGDNKTMAERVVYLLDHPEICQKMGQSASIQTKEKYNLDAQVKAYLNWFEELRANSQ